MATPHSLIRPPLFPVFIFFFVFFSSPSLARHERFSPRESLPQRRRRRGLQALSLSASYSFLPPIRSPHTKHAQHKRSRAIAFLFSPLRFPSLAERFMVGTMWETGYYQVWFELISQTKWSRWRLVTSAGPTYLMLYFLFLSASLALFLSSFYIE